VQRFRGGLVFQAHRHCVSINARLESNKGEEEEDSKKGLMERGHGRYRDTSLIRNNPP